MFVKDSMAKEIIKVEPLVSIHTAQKLMMKHDIRHLPVVNTEESLVGIITDRDIRSAMPHSILKGTCSIKELNSLSDMKVVDIMTHDPITISPTNTIQDALLMIQSEKVGAFPVVDDQGNLKGILSVRDLLRAFINVLGIEEPGILLGILVEEKIGQLKRIVTAVTEENISLASILVARHWKRKKRVVFAYLLTNNVVKIKKKLENMGYLLINPLEWCIDKLPK